MVRVLVTRPSGQTETLEDALHDQGLEAVLVPRQDVEAAETREHLELLVRVLDGEGLLEQVLEGDRETRSQLLDHAMLRGGRGQVRDDAARRIAARATSSQAAAPTATTACPA